MSRKYGICCRYGTLVAIPNPEHSKYDGFVYGTLQRHPNALSAIEEYRQHVTDSEPEARNAESAAAADLERIRGLERTAALLQK